MAFEELSIAVGNSVVRISPERGALVTSLKVDGRETLFLDRASFEDPNRSVRGGIPLLFPFAGRLADDVFAQAGTVIEQHGFARRKKWRVMEHTANMLRLQLDRDGETRQVFPYQYSTELTFYAVPSGMQVELLVMNHSDAVIPIAPGWHPYFVIPRERKTEITGDMDDIPPGEFGDHHMFNFGLPAPINGRAEFAIPCLGRVRISFSPEMRHLQFWSLPERDFVCIEPFFGPANALNVPDQRLDLPPHGSRMLFMRLEFLEVEAAGDEDPRDGEVPWTVFAREAIVHRAPDRTSEPLDVLHEGAEIRGLPFGPLGQGEPWLEVSQNGLQGYLSLTAVHRVHPANIFIPPPGLPIGGEIVDRWWGLPLDYVPADLEPLPPVYTLNDEKTYELRHDAREALIHLLERARADGVEILVCSAWRSAARQRELFEAAMDKDGPGQRYSAPPGHSEHQLGTTVDLCDPEREQMFTQAFGDTPQGEWLEANAPALGWRRSYRSDNTEETGYIPEPWHWRYFGA